MTSKVEKQEYFSLVNSKHLKYDDFSGSLANKVKALITLPFKTIGKIFAIVFSLIISPYTFINNCFAKKEVSDKTETLKATLTTVTIEEERHEAIHAEEEEEAPAALTTVVDMPVQLDESEEAPAISTEQATQTATLEESPVEKKIIQKEDKSTQTETIIKKPIQKRSCSCCRIATIVLGIIATNLLSFYGGLYLISYAIKNPSKPFS
jgi:hypothetical protein